MKNLLLKSLLYFILTLGVNAHNALKFFPKENLMSFGIYYCPEHWDKRDKEIGTITLQISCDAAKIKPTANRNEILDNGHDLTFITIEITDKGLIQPNVVNRMQFKIEGPGVIGGVETKNGNKLVMEW